MTDVKFINNKELAEQALKDGIEKALDAIGDEAEGFAKDYTPVVTSRLRNSITKTHDDKSVIIGSDVEYAPSVEFGSRRNKKPAHMLQKAVENHKDRYKELTEEALKSTSF